MISKTHTMLLGIGAAMLAAAPAQAGLFSAIPGLSQPAKDSLVAYFDGRVGVNTTGGVVDSWDAFDGDGANVVATLTSLARSGGGEPELISYQGGQTVVFDDPTTSTLGRRLEGTLPTTGGSEYTVFWKGHYDSDNRNGFENSGLYAYNISSELSHQRDNSDTGHRVELFDGTTHPGDDILAFDDTDTIWTTVYTPTTHTAFADGVDLNVQGTPGVSVPTDALMVMGAFSSGGFDMLGEIEQFIIFESTLSPTDIALVEGYLATVPEPTAAALATLAVMGLGLTGRRRRVA